jgi:signal transduction histidine kinase/ActR/RegA family two-component response regulator
VSLQGESLKNLRPEELKRLGALSKIGKRINTPERFSEALKAVLDAVVESMEASRGALFLAEGPDSLPVLTLSMDTTSEDGGSAFRYSSTVVEKVWTTLKPVAEFDTEDNAEMSELASIVSEGIRSVICVPLVGRQSKLGLLYLDTVLSNAFTKVDLQMLDVIADLASTALERARFFDALQSLNDELELRVLDRTSQLEAARNEAERATRAKSLFLAKMSHELRTPLNGILGLTEDLAEREQDPALRLQLDQVIQSARSLATLINGVLDFSKLESDQVILDQHLFSPEEAVLAALANVNYEANRKGLEVQVWVDGAVPREVQGDSTRLKQILINLLSNAVKFTAEGHVRLLVSAPREDQLMFDVADSGVGIAQEKQEEIFKPFSQADASTTREFGGTGLGLSISQSLSTLLGGRLSLQSEVGKGSRFVLEVPLKFVTEFIPPDYSGLKIWIAVPSVPKKQALWRALRGWGCESAANIQSADIVIRQMGTAQTDRPSLVLLDPGQAAREESGPGVKRHLMTPVTRSILVTALEELLNPASGTETLEPSRLEETPVPPPGSSIVVVEDHEINRLVIKKMLEAWGYECHLANDGNEAVDQIHRHNPRIVLMDIEMPGRDGYSVAREIRAADGPEKDVPILAVTAHLADDLRERCLASGMDDLLGKPISRAKLAQRLIRWESYLEGEVPRAQGRFRDFPELLAWPGCFLSPINSKLSTLNALCTAGQTDGLDQALGDLEGLAFRAGLLSWGGACVALARPLDPTRVKELLTKFQQEWSALAPSLVGQTKSAP